MLGTNEAIRYQSKVKSIEELSQIIGPFPRDKKVVYCHGVFDIVHPGHMRHMIYAKSKADILVVSITSDEHILKANMRPYVPQELRAINIAAYEMVDYVIIDKNPTPIENLKKIQPDYFAKGFEYNDKNPKTLQEIETIESYGGKIILTPGDIVYSSSKIIETSPPDLTNEKLIMLMENGGITFDDLRNVVHKMKSLTAHVVGDTIVDSYTYCSMIGGMTKTPTMSVRFENKLDVTGGAAIIAKHLKAACKEVHFTTVMGNDDLKHMVMKDLDDYQINCHALIDPMRPTTNKNAIIVSDYRLLKVDTLDNTSINSTMVDEICDKVRSIPTDIVLYSDFRHGIFNKNTIPKLVDAIPADVYKVADSQVASRWGNITEFQGFDLITPNEREARFALGDQDSVVRPLGVELYKRTKCKTLMLKLGNRGMMTFIDSNVESSRSFFTLDSFANHVKDPVGAGDALVAYASLAMVVSKSEIVASILGSIAAALECEYDGNVPIHPSDVLQKISDIESGLSYPIKQSFKA